MVELKNFSQQIALIRHPLPGIIAGRIFSLDGKPLTGVPVQIQVISSQTGVVVSQMASNDGKFEIDVPTDIPIVTVEFTVAGQLIHTIYGLYIPNGASFDVVLP